MLKKLAWLLVPMLLLVVVVNYYVDPGELFYRRQVKHAVAELLLQGHNVLSDAIPSEWGDLQADVIRSFAARRSVPDVVVWGTSRSSEISQTFFPGEKFFNHAIPGGSVFDYVALYGLYQHLGRLPGLVIISIDPWTFCGRKAVTIDRTLYFIPDPDKLLDIQPGLESGLAFGLHQIQAVKPRSGSRRMTANIRRVGNLLSLTYFQSALKNWRLRRPQSTEKDSDADGFVLRCDGSYAMCRDTAAIQPAIITETARRFAQVAKGCFLGSSVMVTDNVEMFRQLVTALRHGGIGVVFYLAPIHPVAYDLLIQSEPNQIELFLHDLGTQQDIPVIGSFNPHVYHLDADRPWFVDQYHPVRGVVEIIMGVHAHELTQLSAIYLQPQRTSAPSGGR